LQLFIFGYRDLYFKILCILKFLQQVDQLYDRSEIVKMDFIVVTPFGHSYLHRQILIYFNFGFSVDFRLVLGAFQTRDGNMRRFITISFAPRVELALKTSNLTLGISLARATPPYIYTTFPLHLDTCFGRAVFAHGTQTLAIQANSLQEDTQDSNPEGTQDSSLEDTQDTSQEEEDIPDSPIQAVPTVELQEEEAILEELVDTLASVLKSRAGSKLLMWTSLAKSQPKNFKQPLSMAKARPSVNPLALL